MIYKNLNDNRNVKYFINGNNTTLYILNEETYSIKKIMRDKFTTTKLRVIQEDKKGSEELDVDLLTIISNDNNFISPVEVISSTVRPKGFFIEENEFGMKSYYLNEFVGSETFLNSREEQRYINQDTIKLLEEKTPTINILLRNLFHNEKDEMIVNFINWLNVVSFQDRNQDIMFLFMGTNSKDQGQGGGKGVFQNLLSKMFNGLVCSVSNTSYNNNFNSNILNKKIVVFDEVNFQYLRYETIKDLTGSPVIRIEYKGKEPFISKNVSSWLFFTNEWDLHNKISMDDRRMFIIRPNPKNGSLKRIINELYNGDFELFETMLYDEFDEFIHIISNVDGKVLSPLELISQGHINYFKEQKKVSVIEISNLYKSFIDKDFKERLFEILDTISQLDNSIKNSINEYKSIINLNTINYKTFKNIFQLLSNYDFLTKKIKLNMEWERLKENLSEFGFEKHTIDTKKSKTYERYKDNTVIIDKRTTNNKQLRMKVNRKYKEVFGIKIS